MTVVEHSAGAEGDSKLSEGAEVGDNVGSTVDTALKFGVGDGVGGAEAGTLVISKLAEGAELDDNIGREVGAKLKPDGGGGVDGAQPLQHCVQQGQLISSQSALRRSKIAMLQTSDGTCPRRLL